MTVTAQLAAAIEIFKELGWADADLADVETLPIGTEEQQKIVRAGLRSGEWGEHGQTGPNTYGWISWIDVDSHMLASFAVRVRVEPARAVKVLRARKAGDEVITRLIAAHGSAYAERSVKAANKSGLRMWEHATSTYAGVVVRLVAQFGLPVPDDVAYLKDWVVYALGAATNGEKGERYPGDRPWCDADMITPRFTEHARAAVAAGVPSTGPLGEVLQAAVARGWTSRREAIDLAFAGLGTAQRPGDRKAWARVLTGLKVSDGEVVDRVDALIPVLAHGDPAVIEVFAPPLIAAVDDDLLPDLISVCLTAKPAKTKVTVLNALARRPRPGAGKADADTANAVAALLAPLVADPRTVRAAKGVLDEWELTAAPAGGPEPATTEGWWQPVPPVWQVPTFELDAVSPQVLTELATQLMGRESVADITVERFFALANALAWRDPEAVREALRGVPENRDMGLRSAAAWVQGKSGPILDQPPAPGRRATVHKVLRAREAAVFHRLGEVPCLMSTPTWEDLRIDPTDVIKRLEQYAACGAPVSEGDLFLAMMRVDPGLVTPGALTALAQLDVPVILQSGELMRTSAGPALATYLANPMSEPPMVISGWWRRWQPEDFTMPDVLKQFPDRLRGHTHFERSGIFPTWGDAGWPGVVHSGENAEAGVLLRQLARRATALTPGLAVNVLACARGFHPKAAAEGMTGILEAWERGLLRPGVADARYLDWQENPTNLAAFAAACRELASEGLLAAVWPVLDDLLGICQQGPRLATGAVDLVEAVAYMLPEVRAAIDAGVAPSTSLDLPGLRALAGRTGQARAVTTARGIVATLPEPVAPPVAVCPAPANVTTDVNFDEMWPPGAGTAPAVEDGAVITAAWLDPAAKSKVIAVDITLPERDGKPLRVIKGWTYDLEHEGQCGATDLLDGATEPADGTTVFPRPDVWLRWDPDAVRLVVAQNRNWHDGIDGPLCPNAPRGPLTTSMVAVALAGLCHDAGKPYAVRSLVDKGLIGSAAVTVAMQKLLTQPDINPARMLQIIERQSAALPALWPVLVESVRYAADLPGPAPRWLPRVLDAAILRASLLAEAVRRGLIPADAASWPGLRALAGRGGSSAGVRKAAALAELLGLNGLGLNGDV